MAVCKKRSSFPILAAAVLLFFGACGNPFQAGLGDKIDITRPEVTLSSHNPGDFLQSLVTFSGSAKDDRQIAAVRISLDGVWVDVDSYDAASSVWRYDFDTLSRPNGTIKIRVRAVDDQGKTTDTEELVFIIDNSGPRIEIQVPAIDPATYDPADPLEVAMNGVIIGIVTDLQGVAVGYPKIMFWEDGDPVPDWSDVIGIDSVRTTTDYRYSLGIEHPDKVGIFNLRMLARDVSGAETVVPSPTDPPYQVKIISSGVPPVVDFSFIAGDVKSVNGSNYANMGYQFRVEAEHPNGIAEVHLFRSRDSVSPEELAWAADDDQMPVRTLDGPVLPVAANGSDDGTYEFRIEAVSSIGGTTELYRTVVVDATPPNVEITNLRPTVVDDSDPGNIIEYVNGTIRINASAGDVNGLEGVKWWVLPSTASAPTSYEDAGGTQFAATPYEIMLDTTLLTDNSEYTFHIIVRDRAGNDGIISRNISVKQSTDIPTAAFTDINPAVTTPDAVGVGGVNLLGSNAMIRGTVADDDRVDLASIEIRFDDGAWVPVDSKTLAFNGKSATFSQDVASIGPGIHRFELRYDDDPSAKFGTAPPAANGTVGPIYFAVDTAPPTLAVTSPGPGTFQRTAFALTGTAQDANGLLTYDFGGATRDGGIRGDILSRSARCLDQGAGRFRNEDVDLAGR